MSLRAGYAGRAVRAAWMAALGLSVAGCGTGSAASPAGSGLLLLHGAVVAGPDPGTRPVDFLLGPGEHGLSLLEVAEPEELDARDTLDASGLYIHSAHAFDRSVPTSSSPRRPPAAMYVLRTGRSPGSAARWLVLPTGVERVGPEDNHPAGPVSPAVGCYTVHRGEWEGLENLAGMRWTWVPETLRLHWQYQWPYGPGKHLVVTDARGRLPAAVTKFQWSPSPQDALRIRLGTGLESTILLMEPAGDGYAGEVRIGTDAGLVTRAPARLDRLPCPSPEG